MALTAASAWPQLQPANSGVLLYLPHLADGGPVEQRWQTTLTFTNSSSVDVASASVVVDFYGDNGSPLSLDFGDGPKSTVSFEIPANGIRVLQSRMASADLVTGWAVARASRPIQGSLSFRMYSRGQPALEIASHSTPPSYNFIYPATSRLGIAVANPNNSYTTVWLRLRDSTGAEIGQQSIMLSPLGHTAFNLWQKFSGLSDTFTGTLELGAAADFQYFVAWALGADASLIYSLPSGEFGWPPYHWERIWRVFLKLRAAAQKVTDMTGVQLEISPTQKINASASRDSSGQDKVTITFALSEFMGDADSEVAAVAAHELAHVIQFRMNRVPDELEADRVGTWLLLLAGYDPYAMLGMLGRLQAAAGDPGLLGQILREFMDTHGSFPTRIATVLDALKYVCSYSEEAQKACEVYKGLFHPRFPANMPLRQGTGELR